jgi:uncharacterized membrane protein
MATNILFGIAIIAIGIYAIAFNKYPGKEMSFENAKMKYSTANERKVVLFDGIFCIIFGVAYILLGMIFLSILLLAYYPIRIVFLKWKLI